MSDLDKGDVLFVGHGTAATAYYRCYLPAIKLGCDWVGSVGDPRGGLEWLTGVVRGGSPSGVRLEDYRVVVLQQPYGNGWLSEIKRLREAGVVVLFEIDDYLHGIRRMPDHDYAAKFDQDLLRRTELGMALSSGVIVSTPYLGKRYQKFNSTVYVCENGLDLKRYKLTKPNRNTINVGWSGGTGHARAVQPWLQIVYGLMQQRDDVNFVSIGIPFARPLAEQLGPERAIAIPFCQIEQYPAAMTMFDIALAPAGQGTFHRAKSQLRFYESGAMGIPAIADPRVYSEIRQGETGVLAANPAEFQEALYTLVDDASQRDRLGMAAKDYVWENRGIDEASKVWWKALTAAAQAGVR